MYCKKETGQALPLGIAFLMSTILLGLVLFNTGQTASEKSRLVNAADAAAYSGLIWQARALNYQAYTNRAMVANQVSIGQMVSLTSWTQYAYIVARNIDYIGDWFPIVKPYTQAAESITSMIDSVMVNIAEAFVSVIDSVNGVLSQSQQAVFMASFAATPGIVREVVERNDSRYSVDTAYAVIGMGQNAVNWNNFTERYENNQGLLRKADVINRSKDEFTNSRNLRTGDMLPGAPNRLDLGIIRVWIKK
ncbi:MAG: Tad domain-containing protein [Candidatus Thiodiazotropha sp.]